MRRVTPEGATKSAVIDLLQAERILFHRLNSGAMLLTGANGKKRMVRMCEPGTADILALVPIIARDRLCGCGDSESVRTVPVYLEIKRAKGGIQSDAQKQFQAEVEAHGFVYLLVSDASVLARWLKERR